MNVECIERVITFIFISAMFKFVLNLDFNIDNVKFTKKLKLQKIFTLVGLVV